MIGYCSIIALQWRHVVHAVYLLKSALSARDNVVRAAVSTLWKSVLSA